MIDVFKVGVHVGMTTNSAQVLAAMVAGLTGVHVAANKVQSSLNAIRAVALGAGAVFAGWAVIKGLADATKHAEKLNHELTKLQTGARLSDAQTDEAKNLAFKVGRDVKGSDVADNVKVQRELFGVFGDMETAKSLLPIVVQGSRATSNFVDKDTDLAQIAVRALELRGHITKDHKVDPKEFAEEFNGMVRSIVASEGLVDPQKLFMFIRQAGPAARNMSSEQMWGMAPAIMNALGSGPAGTALNSLFAQMIGHVVAGKRVAVAMEEAGMLTKGKWEVGKGGKVIMDRDAVPDQAGFMDHPFTWLHEHLQEMRNQKDEHGKPKDILRIVQEIFQFSSRATTARLINDIDSNWPIIENEEKRWKRTPNPDVIAKEQNDKDLSVNIHNLSEAWNNFMAALGGPGIPIAIGVLHRLTDALNVLQGAIIAHPTIAADLFYLAGGLAR
jgi:ribosomal protein S15P/S13E